MDDRKFEICCHHDSLVLNDRDLHLMSSYQLWIDTVRRERKTPEWLPSPIDIVKSRLFWWIRSGHDPLPYPPPTAYSCPWYELIVDGGNHDSFDTYFYKEKDVHDHGSITFNQLKDLPQEELQYCFVALAQSRYDIYQITSDNEIIIGYGPYRFRCFRDIELSAKSIATINTHREYDEVYKEILERWQKDGSKGWWIRRDKDLEDGSV